MLQLDGHKEIVHALTFGEDGQTLISAGKDGSIRVWDLHGRRERARLIAHAGAVLSLALHPEQRLLASGGADGCLKVWDLSTGEVLESYPKQLSAVTGLAWMGNSHSLLMACGERMRPELSGDLQRWEFKGKVRVKSMQTEEHGVWSLATARHGSIVAWGGGARQVAAWDIMHHQQPKSFRQSVASLVVSLNSDGTTMASSVGRAIKLWDVTANRERTTLEGHRGMVRALSFSPDGMTLASGGQDESVRFWRVAGARVEPGPVYQWPIGAVHSLTFSPDGLTAAAAGVNGSIWLWDVDD